MANLKRDIRAAITSKLGRVTLIKVAMRETSTGAVTVNAMDWPANADLFAFYALSSLRTIPKNCVLDCWAYEGVGEDIEFLDHATVTIVDGRVWAISGDGWEKAVTQVRETAR